MYSKPDKTEQEVVLGTTTATKASDITPQSKEIKINMMQLVKILC